MTRPLTAKELGAWLAIHNPTGIWNKYNKVETREDGLVYCTYKPHFEQNEKVDVLTKEEFVKSAGFDSLAHYKEVKKIKEQGAFVFESLSQGMIVWSESERKRYRISTRKDKDTVRATKQLPSGNWSDKRIQITRDFFDTGHFKKSANPQ